MHLPGTNQETHEYLRACQLAPYTGLFLAADVTSCHCKKRTRVTNNVNDGTLVEQPNSCLFFVVSWMSAHDEEKAGCHYSEE